MSSTPISFALFRRLRKPIWATAAEIQLVIIISPLFFRFFSFFPRLAIYKNEMIIGFQMTEAHFPLETLDRSTFFDVDNNLLYSIGNFDCIYQEQPYGDVSGLFM